MGEGQTEPTDLCTVLKCQEGTTQGDPLAMPMYAMATIPLIKRPSKSVLHAVWYADDTSASGSIRNLRTWWDELVALGPLLGYYVNPLKLWLVTKPQHLEAATTKFKSTHMNITTEGRPHLGAALHGHPEYVQQLVSEN